MDRRSFVKSGLATGAVGIVGGAAIGRALAAAPVRRPLANDRLKILDDGNVRLDFKKPWSDGTASVDLEPLAFIARLAALVVPSGPRACPPCPCPTRLRRARRLRPSDISLAILGFCRRTLPHAVPSCLPPPSLRPPSRTNLPVRRSTFRGQNFSEKLSGLRLSARSATVSSVSSHSSRRRPLRRRFSKQCICRQTSRSFIPHAVHARHPATRAAAMTG